MANHIRNLIGVRIGKLVVVSLEGNDKNGRIIWNLMCDCGKHVTRKSASIVKAANDNKPSSCGCSHHLKTHGLSKGHRRLHWVWVAMKSRCQQPAHKDFPNYGARGISVCADWQDFAAFFQWAQASGYTPGKTIERIDVNGDYCPDNCKWIDNRLQPRNRTNTHLFTMNGITQDIRAWSEQSGIPYYALRARLLNYKWPIERATSEPVRGAA